MKSLLLGWAIISPTGAIQANNPQNHQNAENTHEDELRPVVDNILFIGDSMTGWMAERLNAYGKVNGFDVEAVVWDGSTIRKWGNAENRIRQFIARYHPEAVIVSLGLNELGERNPESQLAPSLNKIRRAVGNLPIIWVGPPSWPGKMYGEGVDKWLATKLGDSHYFTSLGITMPRQSKTNPHPTMEGISLWIDKFIIWLKENGAIRLPGYEQPNSPKMSRPKNYIYKKMREPL